MENGSTEWGVQLQSSFSTLRKCLYWQQSLTAISLKNTGFSKLPDPKLLTSAHEGMQHLHKLLKCTAETPAGLTVISAVSRCNTIQPRSLQKLLDGAMFDSNKDF